MEQVNIPTKTSINLELAKRRRTFHINFYRVVKGYNYNRSAQIVKRYFDMYGKYPIIKQERRVLIKVMNNWGKLSKDGQSKLLNILEG